MIDFEISKNMTSLSFFSFLICVLVLLYPEFPDVRGHIVLLLNDGDVVVLPLACKALVWWLWVAPNSPCVSSLNQPSSLSFLNSDTPKLTEKFIFLLCHLNVLMIFEFNITIKTFLTFWIFRSLWILNVKYENRYNSDIKIFDMTWYFRLVTGLLPESSWKFWHNKFYFSLVTEFLPIKSFLEVLSQSQTSIKSLLSLSSCLSSLNTSDCPIMLSLKNLTVSKSRSTRDSRFPW